MEENVIVEGAPESGGMRIGEEDKSLLASTARWSQFISIVMFVSYGLALLFIIFWLIATAVAGFSMYDMGMAYGGAAAAQIYAAVMWPVMVFSLVMLIVQMLPAIYLYRFARKAKEAVASNSEAAMTESFRNLRGSIKVTGILYIAGIAALIIFSVAAVILSVTMLM